MQAFRQASLPAHSSLLQEIWDRLCSLGVAIWYPAWDMGL
jgi:hypothetical protein